jgi:DNA-binding NtrC family response regulator
MANEAPSRKVQGSRSGREAELSALLREHDEARAADRARFAFVRGPAGVGKSYLFALLRRALAERGVEVFEAESPREARRPFGLFAPLVREMLDQLGHGGVPGAQLAALSKRLAALLGHAAPTPSDGARLDLFDAIGEVFALAGRSSPVYLFPDLDAADVASLEVFRYLAATASAPESAVGGLLVGSFRDDAPAHPALAEVLARMSATVVSLAGLDLEGIRAFLARTEVAQRLFETTGGIPDALEELLACPPSKPVALFVRRSALMPASAQRALSVLALSPVPVAAETVADALHRAGGAPAVAAVDLDAWVKQHVVAVKVAAGQPVYRFARETERAVYVEEHGADLAGLRSAVGEALLAAGEVAAGAQLLLATDPAGAGARAALRAAATLAERGAYEEAAAFCTQILPHVQREERPALHRRLAELSAAQGDFRAALGHWARVRGAERVDPAGKAALYEQAARCLIRLGRLAAADQLLRSVAAAAPSPQAIANRVELALLRNRLDEVLQLSAAALPGLSAAPEQAISVRNALGRAHLMRGELAAAERAFEANQVAATSRGLNALAGEALINMGVAAHKAGDRERAVRCYTAAVQSVPRPAQARALANLGSIYAESGDFELALDDLSRALQTFSRLGARRDAAQAASNLARLHHFLGDLDRALELAGHALELSVEVGEPYLVASARLTQGAVLFERRLWLEAASVLGEARAELERTGSNGYASYAAALKARAHLALGERGDAAAELGRPSAIQGMAELQAARIEVELVRAELALLAGDLLEAGRAAARAKDALLVQADLEGPYRVYGTMAKLRLAAGDTSGASAERAKAARLLDELAQRVPPSRRNLFLSLPRRAEVLSGAEPELRLPRLVLAPIPPLRSPGGDPTPGLVGRSPALVRVTRQLEPIARSNATVLIRGESGTGKEVLAQAIHDLSPRRGMPIVKVNCAAMVEELLLSELFGHEKGAFTGAIRERKGRFELADGGTLFLDEIGDVSPKCQVALLRVLQEREIERVGGTRTIRVDVRVICATNRDLESLISQGRFRQDLYYRLKGVMLELPALRERVEDLPSLAQHILARIARERSEPEKHLAADTLELLSRYAWPGNVRELENVLASASIFSEGTMIRPDALAYIQELSGLVEGQRAANPAAVLSAPAETPDGNDYYDVARSRGLSLKDLRREVEMQCISRALTEASGNISEAARLLRMKRSRLSQIVNAEPTLKGMCRGN